MDDSMTRAVRQGRAEGLAEAAEDVAEAFPRLLLDALLRSPGTAAFEQGDRVVSRGELLELIGRMAVTMRGVGIGPGWGVAVSTGVSPEGFAAQMAAYVLGCRVVGVRPGYTPGQLVHVFGVGVDAVVLDRSTVTPELLRAAGSAVVLSLGPVPGVAGAIDLLADPGDGRFLAADPGDGRFLGAVDSGGGRFPVVAAHPDDVALVSFTSGSTGRPKGCALTYRALAAHWSCHLTWASIAPGFAESFQRYMVFGTLSSMVVLDFLAACLLGGGTAVIPEEDGRPLFPYAIERYRITGAIAAVPRLCAMLDLLREERVDVGSLRALTVSGSPVSRHRLREAVDRLGPVVYVGYGATEAGVISMFPSSDLARLPDDAPVPVGRPHPSAEISVRDEKGRPVAAGRTGEIHVRSPFVMAGYWDLPEETGDVLRDGWVRTRDLGHVDDAGLLYLSGRTRDVIMVNAIVVYAGAVERVLAGHPDVAEAYVAGAPDERTGEAAHAFVVPAPGRTPDPAALAELVRADLGEGSVPRTIRTVSAVPVAASGKPDKRALLERYLPQTL
ncbi:AMP-binding protein [Sphaerisporangium sp. TRM90804]|uniref:class I adenylate-forming enzyme family protein n=1 Tax=Sphaerisporangium sp. TRM90804 TaxID=3031113 RepID=UPI002446B3BE|nr:AMP-binding protein [Sphaerisporangium sp. TRM90804]MDH2425619.1 AMP-binding protein [Sphaerisporangium sp. TRM90804]